MDWQKERDLLIAQTMAFVQSVTGQKPDAEPSVAAKLNIRPNLEAAPEVETAPLKAATMHSGEILGPPATPPVGIEIPRMIVSSDVRAEIQARVANFRAHQQRFNRERAEYFNTTLTKLRAAIENESVPDPSDRAPPRR
jgi:hypothetical protein